MHRFRILLVVVLVAPLGGCACLEGGFGYSQPVAPGFRSAVPTAGFAEARATEQASELVHGSASSASAAFASRSDMTGFALDQDVFRDPDNAFCLACVIAGGGHFYTGETTKGAALLGIAAAGLIGGAVLSSEGGDPSDCDYDLETHDCETEGSRTPLLLGAGIAAASWAYGIIDSRSSAERMNARNGLQFGNAGVELRPLLDTRGVDARAGMQLRVTW